MDAFSSFFNLKGDYTKNEILANTCKPKIYCLWEFFFSVENSLGTLAQSLLILSVCISFEVYKCDTVLATTAGC